MFEFKLENSDSRARAWEFVTEHGSFKTPIFMPVWTKASVKWIDNVDLDEMEAEIILNNTYHLYLRPGQDVVKHFGGAHKFQNYHKPILTDSGWFQVFSLWRTREGKSLVKITEDWVHFRSFIDWSKHFYDAENNMDLQSNLWADIIMAFDECAPWDSSHKYARQAMERTHRWAERCVKRWKENNKKREQNWEYLQALFPICQWVVYDDLRAESAEFIWKLDCPWIAIGGLSVWESKIDMYRTIDVIEPVLPKDKPRYLMWVWTPEDLIEWIYRWIDMFDCVLPTRLGRHWVAFSSIWNVKIKNKKHQLSKEPLDDSCECKVCKNYTRWYLRHLIAEWEMLWMQLMSFHNLHFLIHLAKKARVAILENKYDDFRNKFWEKYDPEGKMHK
jgi:queuine tRNA-ribosyltransferase